MYKDNSITVLALSITFLLVASANVCAGTQSNIAKKPSKSVIPPKPSIEEKKNGADFVYHQKSIRKANQKNLKLRVAISRFEEGTEIQGSPFNIKKDEKEKRGETAIDVKDSKVTIDVGKEDEIEKEIPKGELLTGLLTDALRKTGAFDVVERKEINDLIREINFENSEWK